MRTQTELEGMTVAELRISAFTYDARNFMAKYRQHPYNENAMLLIGAHILVDL